MCVHLPWEFLPVKNRGAPWLSRLSRNQNFRRSLKQLGKHVAQKQRANRRRFTKLMPLGWVFVSKIERIPKPPDIVAKGSYPSDDLLFVAFG
jgi:hypothetical protein